MVDQRMVFGARIFLDHVLLAHFVDGISRCLECAYKVRRGICSTVVARWTAGERVERSILHQGHYL